MVSAAVYLLDGVHLVSVLMGGIDTFDEDLLVALAQVAVDRI